MSEDKSRKTEQPTAHRLKELRDKGQVSTSRDLVVTINLVVLTVYFWVVWDMMVRLLVGLLDHARRIATDDFETALQELYAHSLEVMVLIIVPLVVVSFLSIALGSVIQNGFIFAIDPVIPKFEKVNPAEGIKKVFSQKSLVEAAKSLIKILLLGVVLSTVIWVLLPDVLLSPSCGLGCVRELTFRAAIVVVLLGAMVFALEAIFDVWYQKQQFINDNMMSKDEVKRDRKNTEGDPELKSERKNRGRELTETDLNKALSQATIGVRSKEGLVLLQYEAGVTPLPFILLMESGESARNLIASARRRDLRIEEDYSLGKRLWREGKVNQYIPRSTIEDMGKLFAHANIARGSS